MQKPVGWFQYVFRLAVSISGDGCGQQMGAAHEAGRARLRVNVDCDHQIQAEERQIGQVVLGQFFAPQVGVQAAQSAEALFGESISCLGRHDNSRCVSDDNVFHIAPSIDQNADLAANLR
jgi:hypothetical protein